MPTQCPYRKDHEWDEQGMCSLCYTFKATLEPKPEERPSPDANVWVPGVTFPAAPMTGAPLPAPIVTGGVRALVAISGSKMMPLQRYSVLQAFMAGGFTLGDELKAEYDALTRELHPYTKAGMEEQAKQDAWAAMRRKAMESCAHDLDTEETHPDEYLWCKKCRSWIDPHGDD